TIPGMTIWPERSITSSALSEARFAVFPTASITPSRMKSAPSFISSRPSSNVARYSMCFKSSVAMNSEPQFYNALSGYFQNTLYPARAVFVNNLWHRSCLPWAHRWVLCPVTGSRQRAAMGERDNLSADLRFLGRFSKLDFIDFAVHRASRLAIELEVRKA